MRYTLCAAAAAALVYSAAPAVAAPDDFDPAYVAAEVGPIVIEAPWAIVRQDGVVAVSMKLHNFGEDDVFMAAGVEGATTTVLAQIERKDGQEQAAKLDNIPMAGDSSVILDPSGLQVLVIGLEDAASGAVLPMDVLFRDAGSVEVQVSIAIVEAAAPAPEPDAADEVPAAQDDDSAMEEDAPAETADSAADETPAAETAE